MTTGGSRVYLRAITLAVLAVFLAAFPCGVTAAEDIAAPPAYQAPEPEDFSGLAWGEAFDRLHGKFSREYAFTAWKGIDWAALYAKFRPLIERAEAAGDFPAYYLALREYVHSIPDGHVRMSAVRDVDDRYIGGGFGFAAAKLADGRVIASWVDETGAAYAQGLRAGAELTGWNGRPVREALAGTATLFGTNSATAEDLANQQVRYLTRAPLGTRVTLSFVFGGEVRQATMVAYDDQGRALAKSYPAAVVSDGLRELILGADNARPPASLVEKRLLDGGIGYIKLWGEFDADLNNAGKAPSTLGLFRAALAEFNAAGVKGLIIDIRNNVGGLDSMVAEMLASFCREPVLYEYSNCYNTLTGTWEIIPDDDQAVGSADPGLYIRPGLPYFGGPVVALINGKCLSSGEGLAMGIRNLPQGETVGFYGTNGSFGMAGGGAKLPGGIEVHWPFGQSLDKNRQVQIDSRDGIGGVLPTVRTPMTLKNALRAARGEDVELEHAIEVLNNKAGR